MTDTAVAGVTPVREYETIYVLKPDVTRERAGRVAERVQDVMQREGGRPTVVESWGRRRLSYAVAGNLDGVYVYLKYYGLGNVVDEVERNFRMLDDVIKYITVKVQDRVELAGETQPAAFEDIELEPYELVTESRERMLGLDESARMSSPRRSEDDSGDDDSDDGDSGATGGAEEEEE
jgi:small subunit ribosomal protein S6